MVHGAERVDEVHIQNKDVAPVHVAVFDRPGEDLQLPCRRFLTPETLLSHVQHTFGLRVVREYLGDYAGLLRRSTSWRTW